MVLFVRIVLRNAHTSLQILRTIQEMHQSEKLYLFKIIKKAVSNLSLQLVEFDMVFGK